MMSRLLVFAYGVIAYAVFLRDLSLRGGLCRQPVRAEVARLDTDRRPSRRRC
jgi:hypothetical protein